jgi:hypothetical protein
MQLDSPGIPFPKHSFEFPFKEYDRLLNHSILSVDMVRSQILMRHILTYICVEKEYFVKSSR